MSLAQRTLPEKWAKDAEKELSPGQKVDDLILARDSLTIKPVYTAEDLKDLQGYVQHTHITSRIRVHKVPRGTGHLPFSVAVS